LGWQRSQNLLRVLVKPNTRRLSSLGECRYVDFSVYVHQVAKQTAGAAIREVQVHVSR